MKDYLDQFGGAYDWKRPPPQESPTMVVRRDKLDGDELVYLGKGEYVKVRCTTCRDRVHEGIVLGGCVTAAVWVLPAQRVVRSW